MARLPEYYCAVFTVLEDSEGRVLLAERAHTWYRDGWLGLPSGHVEPGELPSEAMLRETLEEIGVRPLGWSPLATLFRISPGGRTYSDFFFRVTAWEWEPANLEPAKCAGVAWHVREALPENVIPSIRDILSLDPSRVHFAEMRGD